MKRVAKLAGLAVVALVVVGVTLFFFGLRIVLDGGGGMHLAFVKTEEQRAKAVAEHREAQRAKTLAGSSQSPSPEAAPSSTLTLKGESSKLTVKPSGPTYWTNFRGPNRDGHYTERPIRTDWPSRGLRPIWKQPIGGGYASFVIAGGRAFTIEQRGEQEVAAAYDVRTGIELWTNRWNAAFREMMGGDGPRATPAWHGGVVYVLGATGELRALEDSSGRLIWRTNILEDAGAENLPWGMAASPLVVDGTVIVLPGGRNGQSVVAYTVLDGKRAWAALDDQAAYSSPMLVTLDGVRQVLVFTASRLAGITPDRGELLWEFPWTTQYDVNASQPLVVGPNRVFTSTGYGKGAAVIELARDGNGKFGAREIWRSTRMKNQFTSSVLHDGFIYGLDEFILACIDASTGDLKWKGGRYGYGQVMLAGGHLIVLTDTGELALVRATPEGHAELARFPVLEGKTWNHPAMSDGYLLIRNMDEMAAFDLKR